MLNISHNKISDRILRETFPTLDYVEKKESGRVLMRLIGVFLSLFLIIMFLPWTQNISAPGSVTTLKPDQRPQTIHSVISGRIEHWYVQEGDYVAKGDTIMFLSETKDEYFDPELLARTQDQLNSKSSSVQSYAAKVEALNKQIQAKNETRQLKQQQLRNKIQQGRLKVTSDSIDYQAYLTNYRISKEQYDRMKQLYEQGLKSLTDLEKREMTLQKAQAAKISGENKLLVSRNELINAQVELGSIDAQYQADIAKAQSDKFTALSSQYDAEATVSKLKNQYSNYSIRRGMYYLRAPQDGYITKVIQPGIGETLKAGEPVLSIMPAKYDLAVEMYVKPIDLPLLQKKQHIRVQFDGWPAIVFSGWPNTSYGTYGGEIFAIDNFISSNGKYRILVAPDPDDPPWPEALRVGGGTYNMILLKDVSIWYELWRQINGFPPDFYKENLSTSSSSKKSDTSKK